VFCFFANALKILLFCPNIILVHDPCDTIDCGKGRCTAPADKPICICDPSYTYNPDIQTCVRLISKCGVVLDVLM